MIIQACTSGLFGVRCSAYKNGMSSQIEGLRAALAQSPDNVPLLLLFASACLEEYNFDEAIEAYERALKAEPASSDAKLGIARTLYLKGKLSEAIVRTEAITADDPKNAAAWLLLARLMMADSQNEVAKAYYERARRVDDRISDAALERDLFGAAGRPTSKDGDSPRRVSLTSSGEEVDADDDEDEEDEDRDPFTGLFGTIEDSDEDDDDDDLDRPPRRRRDELERPTITFADVGGSEDIKEEIRMKILHPMKNPDLFKAYGKKLGGGVLLYGPPGCGKTMISRATAGEIDANFLSIGLHQILDMYLGESERRLHEIFEQARENSPAILFFDEVDALAADRTDMKRSAGRTLINALLAEMDGTGASNEGLLILGATNAPWHIDPAFRRPGRFDRVLFVPPPDDKAREAIIEVLAKNKPIEKLDARGLARKTRDFSGADLKAVFDVATEKCLTTAMREGRVVAISMKDLYAAAKELRPSTRAWFDSAKNYALYANQGGFYNDVLKFLGISK